MVFDYDIEAGASTVGFGDVFLDNNDLLVSQSAITDNEEWAMTLKSATLDLVVDKHLTTSTDLLESPAVINKVVLDSASPFITLDEDAYEIFNSNLKELGWTCNADAPNYCVSTLRSCNAYALALPSFNFTFGDVLHQWATVSPEVYLRDVNTAAGDDDDAVDQIKCVAMVSSYPTVAGETATAFYLGEPFFRNFTVALDYNEKVIQLFRKVVHSSVGDVEGPDIYNLGARSGAFWFLISLVVMFGFTLIAYIAYAIVQCREKEKQKSAIRAIHANEAADAAR